MNDALASLIHSHSQTESKYALHDMKKQQYQ